MEDVHMAVEEAVLKEAGAEAGGNLHIAKSRNDQVATAIRMTLRNELLTLDAFMWHMCRTIWLKWQKNTSNTVILEYTHLQPAQPVTFAHYLLSYVDALERDMQRLQSAYTRVNLSPLGAGALATTSFPINRDRTAELLGFNGLVENSIDAVGSRDFIAETLAALTLDCRQPESPRRRPHHLEQPRLRRRRATRRVHKHKQHHAPEEEP